jgi:NhaA family Na+:H+ antiporter
VHATIAGVLAALAIPAHPRLHRWFLACKLREAAKATDKIDPQKPQNQILADEEKHELLESVEQRAKATRTPLRSWESAMERPVSLLVVPIFAFLNAGIVLSAEMFRAMAFTMSIFIAILSFDNQLELLTEAKASIIRATATAGVMGFVRLWFLSYRNNSSRNPLN